MSSMTVGAVSRIAGTLGAVLFALANLGAAPRPWPLYMSLSRDKVFLREGPTYQHKVLWIYTRKDLPVQIIAKYDGWRRVKDSEGTVGWVHATMVSSRRTVLVIAKHPAADISQASASQASSFATTPSWASASIFESGSASTRIAAGCFAITSTVRRAETMVA